MLEFPRWKYALVLMVVLFGLLYALPNLYPQDAAVQISANRGSTIDTALTERVRGVLEKAEVPIKSMAQEGNSLVVRLETTEVQLEAADLLRKELGRGFTVALNLASTVPDWLTALHGSPLVLGLDLQGGVHFLMEVDQRAALDKRSNGYADDIRSILRREGVRSASVERDSNNIVTTTLNSAEDRSRAASLIARELPELQLEEGPSGDSFVLIGRIRDSEHKAIVDNAIEQNIGTLRNRVNELGVSEPVIQRQGESRIVVQLPGVQDTAQAKIVLGATATLEYRAVVEGNAYEALQSGRVPPGARVYYRDQTGMDGRPVPILLSRRVIVTGDQMIDARSGYDSQTGQPKVDVVLDSTGAQRMLEHTRDNVGNQMAVVFIERIPETRIENGEEVRTTRITERVISVATTQGVFGKRFQTTGLESASYAADLALLLRAGALAAPIDIVEERVIGPSLGQQNIDSGKLAIQLGFTLVCIMMIAYYRLFGVISVIALVTNLLLLTAVLSVIGATLTMPGIAGVVLTLGMAVDGNVLICERIREELRTGNTPIASIKAGYERAWVVILDSNVAKLIAAMALFSFGSGPVRGFAMVLGVGVLTSMFTSVTVSGAISSLIYGGGRKIKSVSV